MTTTRFSLLKGLIGFSCALLSILFLPSIGSAAVTFANPNALSTSAVFDSTGTYVLQLRASDGVKFSTRTVTITVNTTIVSPSLSVVPSSAIAGNSVDVTVLLATGTSGLASLQFDMTLPTGVSSGTVTTGAAATVAGKSATANMVGSALRVIIVGLNSDVIGPGSIAILNLRLSPTLISNRSLVLSGVIGSDPAGTSVPMTSTNGTIVVTANASPTLSISVSTTTITLPGQNSVDLTGVASDDGAPNPPGFLTYIWSVL